MFTGIIEDQSKLLSVKSEGTNKEFTFSCSFTNELKIDQSVAHNGVCLTVTEIKESNYKVVAIEETLKRTNLSEINVSDLINVERCMKLGDRLDGHIVQGHVDSTGICIEVIENDGSWEFVFEHNHPEYFTVPKGSITVNGVSLTVVESSKNGFSVCIIPYTFENTNFKNLKVGDKVNLEFDIIGKYLEQYAKNYIKK